MNYILIALIILQTVFAIIVVDIQEDKITQLEYNLSVSQPALLIYTTPLPPLENK